MPSHPPYEVCAEQPTGCAAPPANRARRPWAPRRIRTEIFFTKQEIEIFVPQQRAALEETGLDGAGAAEGDVSASHARVTVGEDLGVVGLEHLLGAVAVEAPDVDVVELLVHSLIQTQREGVSGSRGSVQK